MIYTEQIKSPLLVKKKKLNKPLPSFIFPIEDKQHFYHHTLEWFIYKKPKQTRIRDYIKHTLNTSLGFRVK